MNNIESLMIKCDLLRDEEKEMKYSENMIEKIHKQLELEKAEEEIISYKSRYLKVEKIDARMDNLTFSYYVKNDGDDFEDMMRDFYYCLANYIRKTLLKGFSVNLREIQDWLMDGKATSINDTINEIYEELLCREAENGNL